MSSVWLATEGPDKDDGNDDENDEEGERERQIKTFSEQGDRSACDAITACGY